jgi:hypothetical protein
MPMGEPVSLYITDFTAKTSINRWQLQGQIHGSNTAKGANAYPRLCEKTMAKRREQRFATNLNFDL